MAAGTFRGMAIQFLCPACSQPIEVDDDWSARPVACPFCRKTVTAPTASTFEPAGVTPQASPIAPSPPPGLGLGTIDRAPRTSGNPVAFWAAGLAAASLAFNVVFKLTVVPRMLDLVAPDATPQELQQAVMDLMSGGDIPGWLATGSLMFAAACALWVAGLVCGIIAVARPERRGLAIGSLALCGVTLVTCCI